MIEQTRGSAYLTGMERDIVLINDLIQPGTEKEWVEFKRNNIAPDLIGKLCSALSNAARLHNKDAAYVLWGIDGTTHKIAGTIFDPDNESVGNIPLKLWLAQQLSPDLNLEFRAVSHPKGNIVILEIPAATVAPVSFNSQAYLRIGSTTPKLSDYPERLMKLAEKIRPYAWENGIAKKFIDADTVLDLIDHQSYFKLTKQTLPETKIGILEKLAADNLIHTDVGHYWNITNLGAILFANDLDKFDLSLSRKEIRLIAYEGSSRASKVTHRRDDKKGYASGFANLIDYIDALIPSNEHIGDAFREEHPLFPRLAVRELIANALIHQDMTITGSGPQIELFEDRIEITNPGKSLVSADRMIDLPPRSRNEAIASLMRRIGLCEEQGSGLDKVITQVELFQLPPPNFQEHTDSMRVTLYAPRSFTDMTPAERSRACYQHAVIKWLNNERMKNSSLCERFGIQSKNAAQASAVIKKALEDEYIKVADSSHPRAGYIPIWA